MFDDADDHVIEDHVIISTQSAKYLIIRLQSSRKTYKTTEEVLKM